MIERAAVNPQGASEDVLKNLSENIRIVLAEIVDNFRLVLRRNLTGVYLHGSLAMGCFNPRTSDIDFIVVVNKTLGTETKKRVIAFILRLAGAAPPKGLEFSAVLLADTQHFTYPTPFELHYSKDWHEVYRSGQADFETRHFDKDLAAHFVIIRQRGICLYGKPIDRVFASVPDEYYWASIRNDAEDILQEITKNPVNNILNLCRVVAFKQEQRITSKAEGGHWGLHHFPPEHEHVIRQALQEYEGSQPLISAWESAQLEAFAVYVRGLL